MSYEYLAWVADLPHGWGVTNGPELALWTAVLAGVVVAGTLRRPARAGHLRPPSGQ